MAVGLNKAELATEVGIVIQRDLLPLPDSSVEVVLKYPGKLTENELLSYVGTAYKKFANNSFLTVENIKGNCFFWDDNWFALHEIIKSKRRAQLIYLDPPYSTGLDFQSRDQTHAYTDTLGSAAYIEFMRRRLILMREILADEGSIYVHIGHQMVAHLKIIMDEVFGKKNFRNIIARKKCSSKNFTKNQYSNLNDYILFYTKSNNYIWNQPMQKPDAAWIAKEYPKVDEKGQYKLVPVHAPGVRHGETGGKWRGALPPAGKHWQYIPSKLDEFDKNGEIHWSKNGNPRRKVYLKEDKGIALSDYWDQFRDAHHQSVLITGYPTEKNFDMLKTIIQASSNVGDLIIDPFCGSGTTLHAANYLDRKWIGIDQSLLAAKTVVERLSTGRRPMGDYVNAQSSRTFDFLDSKHDNSCATYDFLVSEHSAQEYLGEILEMFK